MVEIIGKKIIEFKEIDSTNDEARRLIDKGLGEGVVVVADSQTKGRGKPGSGWFSPSQLGIYLSVIVKPYKNPKELASITVIGAQAVINVINMFSSLKADIKLPNDVILNGKKISGILVERVASGHLIIGVGVNINNLPGSFSEELNKSATSLKIESGKEYDLGVVRDALISELDKQYLAYLNKI